MTSKERITIAMQGGVPDRVPVTLGLSEMVPVRYFTDDYVKFFWIEKIPMWKARVETEFDRFGADCFMHLGENPSPSDPPVEITNVKETPGEVNYTNIIHTKHGDLSAEYTISSKAPVSRIAPFVKSPEADCAKVMDLLKNPDTKDLAQINSAYKEIGARAHAGYWLPMPVDWWDSLRGTQNMIMDLCDYPGLMQKIFSAYTEYAQTLMNYVLQNTPLDSVGLGGSSTSMSVISPDLHREYSLAFGKTICAVAHKHGKPVQYHMCGKSRKALPITAEMGVDGFDALESPPTGDVDLAEVKKKFGPKVSLRGNVNSIHVMLNGKPEDIEKDIIRCMESAKAGGGYILGVGDQTPYHTPEENLRAFVEYGKQYGKYATTHAGI
ncbi:MAG: uroporphyrinogen decarboxylase family protein [Verrucomicrobiota bacterium]